MKRTNFIKLFRSITEWEHYKDCYAKSLFLHLLLSASRKDVNIMGFKVGRGQYLATADQLAEETGISIKRLLKAIETLKQSGEIITERCANCGTLYTVVNFAKYQAAERETAKNNNYPTGNGVGRIDF